MSKPCILVPACFIKPRPYCAWMEACQMSGTPFLFGANRIPAPTLGTFCLLEQSSNGFFRDWKSADALEIGRAVAIMVMGKPMIDRVAEFIAGDAKRLDEAAESMIALAGEHAGEKILDLLAWMSEVPWYGFEMLPRGDNDLQEPFLFSGPGVAGVLAQGRKLGLSVEQTLWDVPLCVLGHLAAVAAAADGQTVNRPRDPEDIREQLKLARERQERGEPQPWSVK